MNRLPRYRQARLAAVVIAALLTLSAVPLGTIQVDNWESYQVGRLDLSAVWRVYPFTATATFKHPPAIALDAGRRVLQLATDQESMRIGRDVKVDVKKTPWLVWEWKPLILPEGGDVRNHRRNDQGARVMLAFEGMKGLLYVWDTTAPPGTEVRPDEFELFQRALVVVRSGMQGVGHWNRERRDVYRDYRRTFEEEPRSIRWVGLESHSDDTRSRSSALFGAVRFEPR